MRKALPWIAVGLVAAGVALWATGRAGLGRGGPSGDRVPVDGAPAGDEGDSGARPGDAVRLVDLGLGPAAVRGRVVAQGAGPVPSARVVVVGTSAVEARGVRTGRDGLFEVRGLPVGPADLRISAPRHRPRTVATPPLLAARTTDLGDVALEPAVPDGPGLEGEGSATPVAPAPVLPAAGEGVVRGVVTDEAGNHLEGAEVWARRTDGPPGAAGGASARTGADGAFEVTGLAPEPVALFVRHEGFAPRRVVATPAPAATARDVTVRLTAGARVVGRVVSRSGNPVAGETVRLAGGDDDLEPRTTRTDEAGVYAFAAVAPGTHTVGLAHAGGAAESLRRDVVVPASGEVRADFQTEGDDEAIAAVVGVVRVGGRPTAGVAVSGWDERGPDETVSETTDADGAFSLWGFRAGRVRIHLRTPRGVEGDRTVLVAYAGEFVHVDLALGTGGVRGRVVAGDGTTPVAAARIRVERADLRPDGGEPLRAQAQGAADGAFSATGLEPGDYRVRAGGAGWAWTGTETFAVADGETKDLGSVRLRPGSVVAGRVTDDGGRSIADARVSVRDARGTEIPLPEAARSGPDGRYRLEGLDPGDYGFRFEAPGWAPAERTVSAGDGVATADAVLLRGGTIAVRVDDDRGRPVEDAAVLLVDERGARVSSTLTGANLVDDARSHTDAEGTATFPDLAPGRYTVRASKDGMTMAGDAVPATVTSRSTASARVVLRGGP